MKKSIIANFILAYALEFTCVHHPEILGSGRSLCFAQGKFDLWDNNASRHVDFV